MRAFIKKNRTLAFFIITFIITWTVFIGVGVIGENPESPVILLGVYGPTLAALIVSAVVGGRAEVLALLDGIARWRAGIQWYAFALLGPAFLELVAIALYATVSGVHPDLAVPTLAFLLPRLIQQILIPGLGEELGWRGFALRGLQASRSPLVSSLIVGLVWGLWHFPGYWMGTGVHNAPAILFMLFILPLTILMTWFFNSAKGSVLMAILFHASFNTTLGLVPFMPSPSVVPISTDLLTQTGFTGELYGAYRTTVLILWVAAVVLVVLTRGRLGCSANHGDQV